MKTYSLKNKPPEEEMVYMRKKGLIKVYKTKEDCILEQIYCKTKVPKGDYIVFDKIYLYSMKASDIESNWVEI